MHAVDQQIEHGRMQDGLDVVHFARRRRAGERKDTRTNDRADAQRRQTPGPQSFAQPSGWILRGPDEVVNALLAEKLGGHVGLALALTLGDLLHLLLVGATGHTGGARSFRGRFLACRALYFFALCFVFNRLSVHSSSLIPAYLATSFFNP